MSSYGAVPEHKSSSSSYGGGSSDSHVLSSRASATWKGWLWYLVVFTLSFGWFLMVMGYVANLDEGDFKSSFTFRYDVNGTVMYANECRMSCSEGGDSFSQVYKDRSQAIQGCFAAVYVILFFVLVQDIVVLLGFPSLLRKWWYTGFILVIYGILILVPILLSSKLSASWVTVSNIYCSSCNIAIRSISRFTAIWFGSFLKCSFWMMYAIYQWWKGRKSDQSDDMLFLADDIRSADGSGSAF